MNLTKLSEETAVLSIKILLKSHPHGLEFKEVNRLFVRRFGVPLDPLSYDCLNLPDFFLRIAAKDKSFLIIDENRIKLDHAERSTAIRLPRPPTENLDEGDEGHLRRQSPAEETPMVWTPPHPKSKVAISAFDTSFSGDKNDYVSRYDTVPSLSLSRPLYKGNVIEIKIVSINDPHLFQVRVLGPDNLIGTDVFTKISVLTRRISNFYLAYKDQRVLQVSRKDFPLEGTVFACPYTSSRTGKVEWRRALVTNTVDSLRYEVFLFDHGTTCEVDYRCLKKLYKPFAAIPSQTAEAQMAGIAPFDLCPWSEDEKSFFKRGVTKCAKNVMLALITNRVEQPIHQRLKLILINPQKAFPDPDGMAASCLNFQMLKGKHASIDAKSEDDFYETWTDHRGELAAKVEELRGTIADKNQEKI